MAPCDHTANIRTFGKLNIHENGPEHPARPQQQWEKGSYISSDHLGTTICNSVAPVWKDKILGKQMTQMESTNNTENN